MDDLWEPDEGAGVVDDPDGLPTDDVASLALHHTGNGRRLVEQNRDRVRHVEETDAWLIWDGMVWAPDTGTRMFEIATAAAEMNMLLLPAQVKGHTDEAKRARGQAERFCIKSLDVHGITGAITAAGARADVRVHADQLDQQVMLLNTPAGVVDLRTGESSPHDPALMMTKITRGAPGAHHEPGTPDVGLWAQLLEEWHPDPTIRDWLQVLMGTALIGRSAERLVIHRGTGLNGKSRFLDAVANAMGTYATTTRSELLTGRRRANADAATPALMAIIGARLVSVDELDDGAKLDGLTVKQLCGGGEMSGRALHRGEMTFTPVCDIHTMTNHTPELGEVTHGIKRRIILVPWMTRIPDDQKDETIVERVRSEVVADQVIAWLIEGARRYLATGLPEMPATVTDMLAMYLLEQDPVQDWLENDTAIRAVEPSDERHAEMHAPISQLWELYEGYARRQFGDAPITREKFQRDLTAKGHRPVQVRNERCRLGIEVVIG